MRRFFVFLGENDRISSLSLIRTIMTYFAPRQGLFAIVMFISLSLQLLAFVVAQEYRINQQNQDSVKHDMILIAEEMSIPLNANDRVSLSVIAEHFIKDDSIDFVGVYNNENQLLVSVGKESESGFTAKETITHKDQMLGVVALHTKSVNRADIFRHHWIYLVMIAFLHVVVFLIYGYIARPSGNMIAKIRDDLRRQLLASDILQEETLAADNHKMFEPASDDAKQATNKPKDVTDLDQKIPTEPADDKTSQLSALQSEKSLTQGEEHTKKEYVLVQIRFDDSNNLMTTVSHHTKSAYFALCDQLLVKSVDELLKLRVLSGVKLVGIDDYNEEGAKVVLQAENRHAKVATAGMMLARLSVILGQIVYDKHRELKRFCLPVHAMVSDIEHQEDMIAICKRHRERVLILLPDSSLNELNTYAVLDKLLKPTSVAERNCRWLKAVSETTAERLQQVCNLVLLTE